MLEKSFIYTASPARVLFGIGTISKIAQECKLLGANKPLVLSTPEQENIAQSLVKLLEQGGITVAGLYSKASMHTPISVTMDALEYSREVNADLTIGVGGGSTIGLGKALSLHGGLRQIAVPTTYAGSEMTPIIGQTEVHDGQVKKITQRTDKVRPVSVIYDVDLSTKLPINISITSGLNAIAHAVEALYAHDTNPIIRLIAKEGISSMARALLQLSGKNDNLSHIRSDALYGAWLCSCCLASTSMALHHKLCHTLGGTFDLPHAETHAIVLPHAFAYNSSVVVEAAQDLDSALTGIVASAGSGSSSAAKALYQLCVDVKAPLALRDFGMVEKNVMQAVDLVLASPYWNPRELEASLLKRLVYAAWAGEPPLFS